MAQIGYARVSSTGQNLETQLDRLAHCDKIFQEKKTGTSIQRPQLTACLEYIREGDILVITKLDRLARSTLHLCQIAQILERKKVDLHVLDQHIDTTHATGRLMFNMLGAIGQFETEIRSERQMEGIHKAKSKGIKFGRQNRLSEQQQTQMHQDRTNGLLIRELMQKYNLSKASVYRYLELDRLSNTQKLPIL